jgi:hypothetical protein
MAAAVRCAEPSVSRTAPVGQPTNQSFVEQLMAEAAGERDTGYLVGQSGPPVHIRFCQAGRALNYAPLLKQNPKSRNSNFRLDGSRSFELPVRDAAVLPKPRGRLGKASIVLQSGLQPLHLAPTGCPPLQSEHVRSHDSLVESRTIQVHVLNKRSGYSKSVTK